MEKVAHLHSIIKRMMLCVILLVLSINAVGFEVDGIVYNITSQENLTVEVAHKEYSGEIVIPEVVTYNNKTYRVTSIGERAFYALPFLYSITIPKSIPSIEYGTFAACPRLSKVVIHCKKVGSWFKGKDIKEVVIGDGTVTIEEGAFEDCHSLKSVTIMNTVTTIGDCAFEACWSLSNLSIGSSVTYIGNYAFHNCPELRSVKLPDGVKTIGENAFSRCKWLSNINIPNSVTSIGRSAFDGCNIHTVNVPTNLKDYDLRSAFESGVKITKGRGIELDGTPKERLELAGKYYNGNNKDKAYQMYVRLAGEGYSAAKEKLVDMYIVGIGTSKDINKALDLLVELSLKGRSEYQRLLVSYKKELFEHPRANILCAELAKTYNPDTSMRDVNQQWASLLCESAYNSGSDDAAIELGKRHLEGNGVEKDVEKAITCFEKAALNDNGDAMLALGELYLHSLLGHFNEPKAIEWYTKAADAGNRKAQEDLGYFYLNGIHVKKNKKLGKQILGIK